MLAFTYLSVLTFHDNQQGPSNSGFKVRTDPSFAGPNGLLTRRGQSRLHIKNKPDLGV
jgi:hypothetical protein